MKISPLLFLGFLSASVTATAAAQENAPAAPPPAHEIPPLPPPAAADASPASPAAAQEAPASSPATASGVATPAVVAAPTPASPETVQLAPPDATDARVAPGAGISMWRIEAGYRGSFVPSAGYDPFSTNDLLPQFSLAASRTLLAAHPLSLAAGLAWDVGSSSATDRGDHASIGVHRITVPIEARIHFGMRGYLFVRGAPGFVAQHTEVEDASAAANLSKTKLLFAADLSGGYAFPLLPRTRGPEPARLWLQADGGYGWVTSERLDLGPTLASTDARIASGLDLGNVSLSGPFFRIALAASF